MNILSKRPLLSALLTFIFCSLICTALPVGIKLPCANILFALFCVCTVILIAVCFCKRRCKYVFFVLALCFAFALTAFVSSYNFFDKKLSYAESLTNEVSVVAQIEECTYSAPYLTSCTAKIKSIGGEKVNIKAIVSCDFAAYFEPGETIIADMEFAPFTTTEYGYDARIHNISEGILISAKFNEYELVKNDSKFNLQIWFIQLRKYIAEIADERFPETAPLIKALMIGDKSDVDAITKTNFSRLGISHILSISGTHFSVLLGMLAVLLSFTGLNKKIVYIFLIPAALFYIGLSGFSFSVCRAGIMALIAYSSFLCGRQKDCYTALFISVFVILLLAPYAIFSISLWLSFIATFTILIVFELLYDKLLVNKTKWYSKLFSVMILHIIITIAISFSTLPIISLYFGEISLIAPLANLVIVPLFEVFLYIIPFALILSGFSFPVYITEFYGEKLLSVIGKLASIENITVSVKPLFVFIIAIAGILATIVLIAVPLKNKLFVALPSLISILLIGISLTVFYDVRYNETHASYFNTGKSDAIVLTDSNKTVCIDITAGTSASSYYTQAVVREHYSTEIYAYVFTHYRKSHINAFEKLASRVKIKKVLLPIAKEGTSAEYMASVEETVKKFNIKTEYYEYGSPLEIAECKITVLEPQFISRTSHEIISVYVSTEKDDLLYLGSSFSEGKAELDDYIDNAEYIIFGQHYPKVKNTFNIETDAHLIYGSGEVFGMSDIEKTSVVLNNGDQYKFVLK